eukprot:SAG22_NODE_19581_length_273_cov_1.155172_2_plen_35_part_01
MSEVWLKKKALFWLVWFESFKCQRALLRRCSRCRL